MLKRGRPALLPDEYYSQMKKLYPNVRTKRGLQNIRYMVDAVSAIQEADSEILKFFFNEETYKFKYSVLTEIGRYKDEKVMVDIARQVYELAQKGGDKPVKEWVNIIRRHRLNYLSRKRQSND